MAASNIIINPSDFYLTKYRSTPPKEEKLSLAKDSIRNALSKQDAVLSEKQIDDLSIRFIAFVKGYNQTCKLNNCSFDKIDLNTEAASITSLVFNDQIVLKLTDKEVGSGSECNVFHGMTQEGIACVIKARKFEVVEKMWNSTRSLQEKCADSPYVSRILHSDQDHKVEEKLQFTLDELLQKVMNEDEEFTQLYDDSITQWNKQILCGLSDIHSKQIIHSDMKLENLMLDDKNQIKITDFGFAVKSDEKIFGGTSTYYAPEQIQFLSKIMSYGKDLVPKMKNQDRIDVWSTMLVLAKLNQKRLSPEFQERLKEYETKQNEIGFYSKQQGSNRVGKAKLQEQLSYYAKQSFNYHKEIVAKRKTHGLNSDGLFSDLTSNNNLEDLLIKMSTFDPNNRISAADAAEFYSEAN